MSATKPESSYLPEVAWSVELDGPPSGAPIPIGELLLVPTQEPGPHPYHSALQAINLVDGVQRWQRPFEYALVSGLARSAQGLVLAATFSTDPMHGEGALVVLDAQGEERYCWAPGVRRVSAPVMKENLAVFTVDTNKLVVLDIASNREQLEIEIDGDASLSAPALAGDVVFVPCRGPHMLAVGLDGKVCWRFDLDDDTEAWMDKTPVVVGECVFAVLSTGEVVALQAADGRLAWRVGVGPRGKALSTPAADGERLYVGARDGLHALSLVDGKEVWALSTERRFEAAPVVADAMVYATCHDHHLYVIDDDTGRELWRYGVARRIEASPSLAIYGEPALSYVFIADRGGTLVAVPRPPSAEEHQVAGRWVEAAFAYAARGDFGPAAELYEKAEAWQEAADLWGQLFRPLKQAEALERHAQLLEEGSYGDEERAAAWEAVAKVLGSAGERDRAASCLDKIAQYRKLPVIHLSVPQDTELVCNVWSQLEFTVRNDGYGPAHYLSIVADKERDEFEGEVTLTQEFGLLRPDQTRTIGLRLRPREYGSYVPLYVKVVYRDQAGAEYQDKMTLNIPVARDEESRRERKRPVMAGRGRAQVVFERAAPGPIRRRWALLVGINEYVDPKVPDLKFCVNDVQALEKKLRELGYVVVTLHDGAGEERLRPTRDNVEAELINLCKAARDDDLLLVHFACHGVLLEDGQAALVTREIRKELLERRALPLEHVKTQMRDSHARRLILTLDACHTGIEMGRDLTDSQFVYHVHERAEGFALIAGSTAQQIAQEWEEKEHGVFTYFMLEALSGKADRGDKGFVTVDDVRHHVLDGLISWSVERGKPIQEPTAYTEGMGDIILADYREEKLSA